MKENIEGRKVLVTGASSGIGRATAQLLIERGANVVLAGRRKWPLEEVAQGADPLPNNAYVITADLSDPSDTENCVRRSAELLDGLDALINAAGILKSGRIEDTTLDLWDEMMNINLRSVFHLMKLAVPYLERSRGNIVN